MTATLEQVIDLTGLPDSQVALLEHLTERLAGRDLTDLGPLDRLADRMVAALPDADAGWGAIIGPVYSSSGLQKWLQISRQAVSQQVLNGRILRLTTADGVSVFPAFQFDDTGERLPGLGQVLDALAAGIDDPWTWAAWLNTPDETGRTQAAKLRQGELTAVCEQAQEAAAAWSRP